MSARNHILNSEGDSVAQSSEETEPHQPASVENTCVQNEDYRVGTGSEDCHGCAAEKGEAVDERKSVLAAQKDSDAEAGDKVNGNKECAEVDCATEDSTAATKCSPVESHEEECSVVKQNSCATDGSDVSASVHVDTSTSGSGEADDNTVLNDNCSKDKDADDGHSVHIGSNGTHGEGCDSNDETCCNDVTERSKFKDENKSGAKPADRLVSNGHSGKKSRGRPKKSSKKRRKKREHSNVANSASVTEVQETDYEPTKKLGRPSKKSKLAQLAAEGCDSLPQSEDDIPLIELRRSARANKGQRNIEQLVLEQPKKRNRAKNEEKERKRAEKEEKRRKREAELQEQAALKAKKVRNVLLLWLSVITHTHMPV